MGPRCFDREVRPYVCMVRIVCAPRPVTIPILLAFPLSDTWGVRHAAEQQHGLLLDTVPLDLSFTPSPVETWPESLQSTRS